MKEVTAKFVDERSANGLAGLARCSQLESVAFPFSPQMPDAALQAFTIEAPEAFARLRAADLHGCRRLTDRAADCYVFSDSELEHILF